MLNHRRLCRVKNMLAMYLKFHKAGLTPTTPLTSIAISPVKMSIGCKSLTNLRSEMIFSSRKTRFLYHPTIYTPILTDNPQILLTMDSKAKVGHVRHISAFRSFSGFIIALRNIPEKFRKKSSGNVIIYQYCYCIIIMFFKYNYFLCLIFSIICIPRSTEVFIHFVSHILAPCNVSSV